MANRLVIYTDGGARGNPGPAAIGFVILDEHSNILKNVGMYIGTTTNNQAEYKALIQALEEAIKLRAKHATCYLDSELVVRQLIGRYKVREAGLKDLIIRVLRLTSKFKSIQFKYLPREQNKLADKLVNQTLDKAGF